ncbi:MAG: metallophosphoesterase [Gorillibacterium sp.]|nr:metallophosphoesterase [Gorillibacterium sp.]
MKLNPRILTILILFLLIYGGFNVYIGLNGLVYLESIGVHLTPWLYWTSLMLFAYSYLLGRSPILQGRTTRFLKVVGSYYFAIMEYSIILLPLVNLAAWLLKRVGADSSRYIPFLGTSVLVVFVVLLLWGSRNAWSPVVRTYEFQVDKQGSGVKELRVAMVSDIHLGNIVGNRHLGKLISKMNALQPDLILLPGDIIDDDIEPFLRNGMSTVMKELKAKYGVFAALGNHEYYGGHLEAYIREMESIGIKVLLDESILINDAFYVTGRKDKTAESMDPKGRLPILELLKPLDHSKPIIVMDHQPYRFDLAAEAGADVLLSGHTHRGQFAPNHWVTGRLFELDWGYLLKDKLHVIVSSGYGTWGPPIRLASRSEIIELVIHFQV